ncbi:hypothetical protein BBBOND_0204540 [Babesia bigemina]|uniref:Uncharacterized protein n=1 Tax=Babesia bigemina TaxID=5866 RepID=A0A061D3M9_BABBI|nr:hypothetical protein BBBOND_0204540 [Babesia bigemina]CDR95296.1 hypothetical protein BBBOND_0204540 [Babesia bigemina]|eukprot:XP_012767482.1 hypothetical protein BBBOND_0204540 [Babesia bigemina]
MLSKLTWLLSSADARFVDFLLTINAVTKEVADRIHAVLGRQIGLSKETIDAHKIESEVHGKYRWIAYDKTVKFQKTKEYNRPDIILADRRRNTITIVEIGISNQYNLVDTEFKKHKCEDIIEDLEARQFNQQTKIRVIP